MARSVLLALCAFLAASCTAKATKNACKLSSSASDLNEGILSRSNPTQFATNTGTLKAAIMFVDFPDAAANDTISSLYDILMPGAADFYSTISYGRLNISLQVDKTKFYRMPQASAFYRIIRNDPGMQQERYIRDAMAAAVAQGNVTWTSADVLWIIPTRAAVKVELSPTSLSPMLLPGHATAFKSQVTVGQDLHWKWKKFGAHKLLNHETGHSMGLPDLYPGDNFRQSKTKPLATGEWVGGFDIMGLINGSSPDYFAWHKWKLGWLADEQVACIESGTVKVTIAPIEVPGGIKAAVVKLSTRKAFVLEVRSQAGVNAESCSVGLLPYIVDTQAQNDQGPPIRVLNLNAAAGSVDVKGCAPERGGPLSSAAIRLDGAGKAAFESKEHGVSFTVDAVKNGIYEVSVTYSGSSAAAKGPAVQPTGIWPWGAGVGPVLGGGEYTEGEDDDE